MDTENTPPVSSQTNQSLPINNDLLFGILSYLGILVIIPLVIKNKSSFARFHSKQGLVLFLCEVILSALGYGFFRPFGPIIDLVNLLIFILFVIGIINVVQHKEKELPVIGHLANSFNF